MFDRKPTNKCKSAKYTLPKSNAAIIRRNLTTMCIKYQDLDFGGNEMNVCYTSEYGMENFKIKKIIVPEFMLFFPVHKFNISYLLSISRRNRIIQRKVSYYA